VVTVCADRSGNNLNNFCILAVINLKTVIIMEIVSVLFPAMLLAFVVFLALFGLIEEIRRTRLMKSYVTGKDHIASLKSSGKKANMGKYYDAIKYLDPEVKLRLRYNDGSGFFEDSEGVLYMPWTVLFKKCKIHKQVIDA
jgi:hypothetical protein